MFSFTKIHDYGSSHPINARISIGLSEILKVIPLEKSKKDDINELLFYLTDDLVEAEKYAKIVIEEIEAIEGRIVAKAHTTTIPSEFESAITLNNVKIFIKYCLAAFKKIAEILAIIFDKGWAGPGLDQIINDLESILPHEATTLHLLKTFQPWNITLLGLRNNDEHGKKGIPFIKNYEIQRNGKVLYLERPRFALKKIYIHEFLNISIKNLLPFFEMTILASFLEKLPEYLELEEIPEEKRDPSCPRRFKLTLANEQIANT